MFPVSGRNMPLPVLHIRVGWYIRLAFTRGRILSDAGGSDEDTKAAAILGWKRAAAR